MASAVVNVYPLESYKIGQKEERPDKDATMAARFNRMCVCLYDIVFVLAVLQTEIVAYSGAGCALWAGRRSTRAKGCAGVTFEFVCAVNAQAVLTWRVVVLQERRRRAACPSAQPPARAAPAAKPGPAENLQAPRWKNQAR